MVRANVLGFLFIASVCFFVVFGTIFSVSAASAPPTYPAGCPAGSSTGDPSSTKTFSVSQIANLKSYLQRVIYCTNVCYNERISVTITNDASGQPAMSIKTVAVNKCKTKDQPQDDTPQRGCAKGQIQPTVISDVPAVKSLGFELVPAQTIGPKSRCDANISSIVGSMLARSESNDLSGYKTDLAALQGLPSQATPTAPAPTPVQISLATPQGRDQIIQELAIGTGITSEEAKVIVERDPEAVIKAINAISKGTDPAEIRETVTAIGLSPTLADTTALRAVMAQNNTLPLPDSSDITKAPSNTFSESPDTQPQVKIADALAPMCAQLGGCSDTACQYNSGSLTCRTNNPGALTWAAWEAKYGGQPCGQPNNTACFPSVEHGLAAKIGLLTGPRYFGGENNTILSAICNAYATNAAGNNCAAYATFIQNQTGIPMNQTVDAQNPEQMGKIIMAISRYENGKFVAFTPQQLETAMSLVYGGALPNGTPGFIPSTVLGTNNGTQFTSPFNFNSTGVPATVGYGSPFANVSPAPITQSPSTPSSYSPLPVNPISSTITAPANPFITPRTSGTSTVAQELIDALRGTATVSGSQLIANIVVQPNSVTRGNPVTVAWTSVGMSAVSPCVVRAGSTVIAEVNQGSRVVPTGSATRQGSLVFTLACTTVSGETIQRTAATFVQ